MFIPLWLSALVLLVLIISVTVFAYLSVILVRVIKNLSEDTGSNTNEEDFLAAYIKRYWLYLGVARNGSPMRIAIYGIGSHTEWLHNNAAQTHEQGPEVKALIDDKALCSSYWGLFPVKLEELNIDNIDAIVISTDVYNAELRMKCKNRFGEKIKIIDFYEALHKRGPYLKTNWI